MKRLALLFLIILSTFACKSVKKRTAEVNTSSLSTAADSTRDSTSTTTRGREFIVKSAQISKETLTGLQPLDSAGVTVFKPFQRTIEYSTTTVTEDRAVDSTRISVIDQAIITEDIETHKASQLDKEIEAAPIVGPLADILFPSWLKIASMILILLISCGFGILQRRKNKRLKENLDQNIN